MYSSIEEFLLDVVKNNERVRNFFAKKAEVERSYSLQLLQLSEAYPDCALQTSSATPVDRFMCAQPQLYAVSANISGYLDSQSKRVHRALHQFDATAKYLLKYMEAMYKEEQQVPWC